MTTSGKSSKTKPRATPKPYHHGNLRETLLDAADVLLAQGGATGLTLREVARAAGVSHAAPYHHFASLDDLLAAVAARSFTTLGQSLAKAAAAPDAREALLGICETYVAHACAHPAQFRLMFGPMLARKTEFPEFAQAARAAFDVVLQASTRLVPGQSAADAGKLTLAGWSLAHGFANLAIDGAFEGLPVSVSGDASVARELAETILGLAPTHSPPGPRSRPAGLYRSGT